MSTIDDLTGELPADEATRMRAALSEIAALADGPAPLMSAEVRRLVHHGVRRRIVGRRAGIAALAGVFALGGTSVAAAQNVLPAPAQAAIARFADDHLPITVPRPAPAAAVPTQPTNAPSDAPGQLKKGPKAAHNTDAPGQIQKQTKPDPRAPGPARPADPGSHGRAHGSDDDSSRHKERTTSTQQERASKSRSDDHASSRHGRAD